MKTLTKIEVRYVASAVGIALLLLVLNAGILTAWLVRAQDNQVQITSVAEIADGLTKKDGGYAFSPEAEQAVRSQYVWAMLLDDSGNAVWNMDLPEDVPLHYTVPETASFSKWYLRDYPVRVYRHPDGLLVLGCAKNSVWKMRIELPDQTVNDFPVWAVGAFVLNALAAVVLALLAGYRLFRSAKALSGGIESLAENDPVALAEKGLLGGLAQKLNRTSECLSRQAAELEKRDTARTAWIAGISHDVRTPLSMVMGYAGELAEAPGLTEEQRAAAGVVLRQSERIRTLVNDLNLASKLEYGMQPLRVTSVRPAALVRGVAADFLNGGLEPRFSIRIAATEEAQRAAVEGDAELLRRAVSNLIGNSIRHNPDGCSVDVSLESGGGLYVLGVSDDGKGYPPGLLAELNAPEAETGLSGRCLGLTIVRQITRVHGGSARFENLPGGGCRCVLQLPCGPGEGLPGLS